MELVDLSDLLCSIEVWFKVLSYLEPSTDWSWSNPKLETWMIQNGYSHRRDIPASGLWLINRTLENHYQKHIRPDTPDIEVENQLLLVDS